MFQAFQQGKDSPRHWDNDATVRIQAGRYKAHITSPRSSSDESAGPGPRSLLSQLRGAETGPTQQQQQGPPRRNRRRDRRRRAGGGRAVGDGALAVGEDEDEANERSRLLRPSRRRVEDWLDWWPRRWAIFVLIPSGIIWCWAAVPFPVSDPYDPLPPNWDWPPGWNLTASLPLFASVGSVANGTDPSGDANLPVDVNFWFFLLFYFSIYLLFGLFFITSLFSLYRLNWWPSVLGARVTYFLTWLATVSLGAVLHHFDGFGIRGRRKDRGGGGVGWENDWERKTLWVGLAGVAMCMPAVACFVKLRRDRRMSYRHSMTETQRTFLEHVLGQRIPRSYIRFLWFLACLGVAVVALLTGQGFASLYLSTLPHYSALDAPAYVWAWIATVQALNALAGWILEAKVRSRALAFVFRYYFFAIYFVFYRNLFARLRDPTQYLTLQLLTSSWIFIWYPLSMSRAAWRTLRWAVGYDKDYEEHLDSVAQSLFLRNLAENVTMMAFLGWLSILHFGPNREVYPFFAFESDIDPYNYNLTVSASAVIWATELVASFLARRLCWLSYGVDVTNSGLDELREYPELVPALVATSLHILSDMLLFLLRLNFR